MPESPILLVPYMWIGDFVRCHTVVRLLNQRFPEQPVDVLTTSMVAPLLDYMPGVRKGIVVDLPRTRLALGQHRALARRLRAEGYGRALIMPRTWKSALAPALAGVPERIGFMGEARFGLVNDLRFGERRLPRMVDRCAALALPKGADVPARWPLPELKVPGPNWRRGAKGWGSHPMAVRSWHSRRARSDHPSAGPRPITPIWRNALRPRGHRVWVIGGPGEKELAAQIVRTHQGRIRDLTGPDLRNAILALAAANTAVSNDSGLLHVAAALGTPAVGIFGPTSPWHWAPLNPIAAVIETTSELPCRPCHKPVCRLGHHLCMRDISVEQVSAAICRATSPPHRLPSDLHADGPGSRNLGDCTLPAGGAWHGTPV